MNEVVWLAFFFFCSNGTEPLLAFIHNAIFNFVLGSLTSQSCDKNLSLALFILEQP